MLSAACLIICASLQPAPAKAGAGAPPPSVSEVIVKGRRSSPSPERKAHEVVEAITRFSATDDTIVRRFYAPCFKAVGAAPAYAGVLGARLAAAVALTNLPAPRTGCAPDILVVFTPDVERFIAVSDLRGWTAMGAGFTAAPRKSGPHGPRRIATFKSSTALPSAYSGIGSRIHVQVEHYYTKTVIVVQQGLLEQTAPEALGDYLAMLSLTSADETSVSPQPSIVNLLAGVGDVAPTALTSWDKAYLAAYYKAFPDLPASFVLGQISRQMVREAAAKP